MQTRTILMAVMLGIGLAGCGGGDKNHEPLATGGTLTLNEDETGTISLSISDPDNDLLTASIATPGAKGTASASASSPFVFTYVPKLNANGADGFDVQVTDPHGASATAHVAVNIVPQPDPVVIAAQGFNVDEDSSLDSHVVSFDPDGDAVTINVSVAPMHGTVQMTDPSTGTFHYTPAADFNGTDSFTIQGFDGGLTSTVAVMTLSVKPVNDPPVASDDTAVISLTSASSVDVLTNDVDIDGDNLAIDIVSPPPGATASVDNGTVLLTPAAGAAGPTRFTYRITDAGGLTATATARVIIGSMTPVFFTSDEDPAGARIFRYDGLSRTLVDTPVPAGETLEGFATAENGSRMIYVSRVEGPPVRERLWLKDLVDPATPVREILTGAGFFASSLQISRDGRHAVFNSQYVSLTTSTLQQQSLESGAERVLFTRNSQNIFYPVLQSGGGRVIKRTQIGAGGGLGGTTQMTADYPVAQGLGITFGLSPDETLITSTGLISVIPMSGPSSYAYVTPADGSRADLVLHPAFTQPVDHANQPFVTADSRYAYFDGDVGGVSGLYAMDLHAPGTTVRIDAAPSGYFVSNARAAGDSRTVFYLQGLLLPNPSSWYRGRLDQPGMVSAFAPSGAPTPQALSIAPDGAAVAFTSGNKVYVSYGDQFSTATPLLETTTLVGIQQPLYAPDSSSIAVKGFDARSRITVLNPKAPGWTEDLGPSTGTIGVMCVAYAGGRC